MSKSGRGRPVWPMRLAASEGRRNACSARWVSVIVVLANAWTVSAVALANALDVSMLVRAEREWTEAGAHTFIVEAGGIDDAASVDVAACERLATVTGITGSFAASATRDAAVPTSAPGTRATVALVSPGIFAFFDLPAPTSARVLATPTTLEPLGLRAGDTVDLGVVAFDGTGRASTARTDVAVVSSPVLGDDLAGAWLMPDLVTGSADRCYVRADPAHAGAVERYVVEALAAADGTPALARPRLSANTYGLDFTTAYHSRPLAWGWVAAAVALAALWAVISRTRRSRLAIYATFGAHRSALLVLQAVEWTVLSALGLIWGWAIALALAVGLGVEPHVALVQLTGHGIAIWACATSAVLVLSLLPVGTLLSALKDGA